MRSPPRHRYQKVQRLGGDDVQVSFLMCLEPVGQESGVEQRVVKLGVCLQVMGTMGDLEQCSQVI